MKKHSWVEKAKAAVRARDRAQRVLDHGHTKERYTLVQLAAQELLGFRPLQILICTDRQAFEEAEYFELHSHWTVQEIYFADDPERDVLKRSPEFTVRLACSGEGSLCLTGKRTDFRSSFKVVPLD